jgi:hypothetical protein
VVELVGVFPYANVGTVDSMELFDAYGYAIALESPESVDSNPIVDTFDLADAIEWIVRVN